MGLLIIKHPFQTNYRPIYVRKGEEMFYKISAKTQAIMNVDQNYYKTKIIEEDAVAYSPFTPVKLIDYNCTENGASLDGRAQTVKKILGIKSKLPIPILHQAGIYMFPTTSVKNKDCIWLSYYHIKKYVQHGKQAMIYLADNSSILINISLNQLDLQIKRTSQVIAYFHYLNFLKRK